MRPGRSSDRVEGVEGLSTLLKKAGAIFGAEDVADALWLAGQIGGVEEDLGEQPQDAPAAVNPNVREEFIESDTERSDEEDGAQLSLPRSASREGREVAQADGLRIQAPAAPALRIRLDLARALRPLRRTVPSPGQVMFDEAATVERIADQNLWSPVLRPLPERWLDVAMVVEASPSLVVWKETIREFQTLLERQGAFRRVTTWLLRPEASHNKVSQSAGTSRRLELFPNWKTEPKGRPYKPQQLFDPAGRRLILLVSDCTSEAWYSGEIFDWLEVWGEQAPMTVVQLLPERLWSRSALELGVPVRLRALDPGTVVAKLNVQRQNQLLKQLIALTVAEEQEPSPQIGQNIVVPVVTLEAEPLKQWAKVVAGCGDAWTTGVELDRAKFRALGDQTRQQVIEKPTPVQRVQRFRATASLMAQRLAASMAAVPVDPAIVNLIRQTLWPQAEPVHVAEVFMGGLMDAQKTDAGLRYYFPPEVQELLLDGVRRSRTKQVLEAVSAYISERLGLSTRSFEALLVFAASGDAEAQGLAAPFAEVALRTLVRMGDGYAVLAERVSTGQVVAPLLPEMEEAEEWIPPLQPFEFREATLEFVAPVDIRSVYQRAVGVISSARTGDVVGCGFLIADRYVATAASVIQAIDELDSQSGQGSSSDEALNVSITFPAAGKVQYSATLVQDNIARIMRSMEAWIDGIVLLSLSEESPGSIVSLPLLAQVVEPGTRCQIIGSSTRSQRLEVVNATIEDQTEIGFLRVRTVGLESGFAGAPVWDSQSAQVVGMIMAEESSTKVARQTLATPSVQLNAALQRLESGQTEVVDDRFPWFSFETASIEIEAASEDDPDLFGQTTSGDRPPSLKIIRRQQRARQLLELLPEGVELRMVLIPSDSFVMGSPEDEAKRRESEGPQHEVTFSEPFWMGKYPVTQTQWRAVAAMPQVNRELDSDPSSFKGDNRPVESIDWFAAVEFCDRLSNHTGRSYRLPSEAEWEYACRAGTTTPFHFGETLTTDLANYNGNYTYGPGPEGEYRSATTDVGSFPANAFGLYDMHGNVDEWCQDRWHENYSGATTDGSVRSTPPENGEENSKYVLRGGSWDDFPVYCRSATRFRDAPDDRSDVLGLRVVCALART